MEREVGQPVQIKDDVPSDLYARANRDLLERALSNVVRNAVRYAGVGGPIALTASSDGERVLIRFSDCGPGLPESKFDRIFDPFYRLDSSAAATQAEWAWA